jgi:2-keto-3-deoxy-L-fuconate dehydrogenase
VAGRLAGKTAFITAAGQGIGRGAALAFAREGAQVWATDVNAKVLSDLEGKGGIRTRVLDVLDEAAIAKAAAEVGPVDVLFNCAGFVHHGTILECTPKDWDFSFNLNVKSMYLVTRAFLPGMQRKGRGSIINMSSIASHLGYPVYFAYSAAKGAVRSLSKALAVHCQMNGYNVRVNTIHPGAIDTPMVDQAMARFGLKNKADVSPVVGMGTPDDVAHAVLFLASDESRFVNGTEILIDNALSIR